MEEHKLEIPKNYFCDSNDLTMAMNCLLSEQLKEILYFDNINGFLRIEAKTKQSFIIGFPKSLCPILGMYDYPQGEVTRTFKADNYHMFEVKKDSLYDILATTDRHSQTISQCYDLLCQFCSAFYHWSQILPNT